VKNAIERGCAWALLAEWEWMSYEDKYFKLVELVNDRREYYEGKD
jgi:hypothetical protein